MLSQYAAYITLCRVCTVISASSSGVMLILISDMQIWNNSTILIFAMSVFQLIYDISIYFLVTSDTGSNTYVTSFVFVTLGGLMSTLISNVISYSLIHVLRAKRIFDVRKNWWQISLYSLAPTIVGLSMTSDVKSERTRLIGQYYFTTVKLFVIFINVCGWFYAEYLVGKIYPNKKDRESVSGRAITTLMSRMKWYPIFQIISRIGFTWYELGYGFDFNNHHKQPGPFTAICLSMIVVAIAAFGYLAIFLALQPCAYRHVCDRLHVNYGSFTESTLLINKGSSALNSANNSDPSTSDGSIGTFAASLPSHPSESKQSATLPSKQTNSPVNKRMSLANANFDQMDDEDLLEAYNNDNSVLATIGGIGRSSMGIEMRDDSNAGLEENRDSHIGQSFRDL